MIERHLPEMGRIWTDEAKVEAWKRVEVAACEGWGALRVIPRRTWRRSAGAPTPWSGSGRSSGSTTTTWAPSCAPSREPGPGGALRAHGPHLLGRGGHRASPAAADACDLLLQKARALTAVLERQALAYKDTPQMGRSHGVHAEPITFGFKLLLWVEEMRATCSAWSGPGRRSPWARSPGPWAPTPTSPRRWRSTSAPPWGWPSTPSPARSCSATATPSCCAPWP